MVAPRDHGCQLTLRLDGLYADSVSKDQYPSAWPFVNSIPKENWLWSVTPWAISLHPQIYIQKQEHSSRDFKRGKSLPNKIIHMVINVLHNSRFDNYPGPLLDAALGATALFYILFCSILFLNFVNKKGLEKKNHQNY